MRRQPVSPQSRAKASARLWLGVLALSSPWGAGGATWAQAPFPAEGAELRVNSYTTYNQDHPSVASDASGNFVVVWQSDGQDGSGYGIFGQRFSANGVPRGAEFQVNAYTTNVQSQPAVASDANGNFVVVWRSRNQDGSDFGVFGRRFDAAGTPQSSEFQVNTYTTGFQSEAAVVYLSNGNFVVAWDGFGSDTSMIGVFARQFDVNGSPLGSQFQVNSFTTDYQYLPALAADPNGGFVVTWSSYTQDGDDGGVFARRYDAAGAPAGRRVPGQQLHDEQPGPAPDRYGRQRQFHRSVDEPQPGWKRLGTLRPGLRRRRQPFWLRVPGQHLHHGPAGRATRRRGSEGKLRRRLAQ